MGYYNRHFNKQLNRKGFYIVQGIDDNKQQVKVIVHRDNIKPRMKQADFATPKQYGAVLSGR